MKLNALTLGIVERLTVRRSNAMKRWRKIGKMLATLLPMALQEVTMTQIFMSEFMGTAVLLLLGGGVVATNLLPKSKGRNGGWLLINWGWGLAVLAGRAKF